MWLSILCPSCRPLDLTKWLNSLYNNCVDPKSIELSLTLEEPLDLINSNIWGNVVITHVKHGQYNINQLTKICYEQSTSEFTFLSGDDTICRTNNWDAKFKFELDKYKDRVVLVYPNDLIFGKTLACYPITSRKVMDEVFNRYDELVPFERYAIDDSIFDIVPRERRIYLNDVIMEHLHYNETGPGHQFVRNGKTLYYPINQEIMQRDRNKYMMLQGLRNQIREGLELQMDVNPRKVLIGVPTAEMARNAQFYDYFNMLEKPSGTIITMSHGQSPARNRNLIIEQALNLEATHILFLDDDVAFKPTMLNDLLKHDVPIVTGLYLKREYPHFPIIFAYANEKGECAHAFPTNDHDGYVTLTNQGMAHTKSENGLVPIAACGLGACLIKIEVFKQIPKPWITLGELEKDHWCDDISFFNRCREAGIKMYCDLNICVEHFAQIKVGPMLIDGKWCVSYNSNGSSLVSFPSVIPDAMSK